MTPDQYADLHRQSTEFWRPKNKQPHNRRPQPVTLGQLAKRRARRKQHQQIAQHLRERTWRQSA